MSGDQVKRLQEQGRPYPYLIPEKAGSAVKNHMSQKVYGQRYKGPEVCILGLEDCVVSIIGPQQLMQAKATMIHKPDEH